MENINYRKLNWKFDYSYETISWSYRGKKRSSKCNKYLNIYNSDNNKILSFQLPKQTTHELTLKIIYKNIDLYLLRKRKYKLRKLNAPNV